MTLRQRTYDLLDVILVSYCSLSSEIRASSYNPRDFFHALPLIARIFLPETLRKQVLFATFYPLYPQLASQQAPAISSYP